MITAEELVQATEPEEGQNNFKLATVVELFDNDTAKIQFDGEDTPSEKQYAYLDSYTPKKDDRVLLGALGGTYVILGKVNYNVSPSTEEEVDRYLFDLKKVIMEKGLKVTLGTETDTLKVNNAATLSQGATIVGNVGVNGNVMATGLSATGQVSAGNANINGDLQAGSTTVSGLTSNGTLVSNGSFDHRGSYLRFFNKSYFSSKKSVANIPNGSSVDTVISRVNTLLDALKDYGLIG